MECWTDEFQEEVSPMPVEEPELFKDALYEWVSTSQRGSQLKADNILGFIDEDLVFFKILAESRGRARDTYDVNYPIYLEWETYFERYRETAP